VDLGEFVALVGPNGAGKTTLLRILATLTRPTSGTVRLAGLDPARSGDSVRRRIGFLSHHTLLYEDLTAEQNLRFYARMYDLDRASCRIQDLLERVGLVGRRYDLVRTLSRGMQQRLAVARAVLHRPQVLLLDEPYTGLDPQAAQALTGLLAKSVEEGCTILLTTHNLERGLSVGQRVVVLVRGRVVYDERRDAINPDRFSDLYDVLATT
jgi:heme exporter protein A